VSLKDPMIIGKSKLEVKPRLWGEAIISISKYRLYKNIKSTAAIIKKTDICHISKDGEIYSPYSLTEKSREKFFKISKH